MNLPYIVLPSLLHQLMLNVVADELLEKQLGELKDILVCSNKVFKISYENPCNLDDEFEDFTTYIREICSKENFKENLTEFTQNFNERENFNYVYLGNFGKSYFGTLLYLTKRENNQIKVMFFIYK